jgi:hypothetical protein
LEEHLLCLRQREGHFDAIKLSDFLTQRELHRTSVYDNWFRPLGNEHELVVATPSPWWHSTRALEHLDVNGYPVVIERQLLRVPDI